MSKESDEPSEGPRISGVKIDKGDVFIGTKNQYSFNFEAPKINPQAILILVEQYKNIDCKSEEFRSIKDELEEYDKPRPARDIIGLANKLKAGGREDLLDEATACKDKFAKRLSRYEFSTHHAAIHLNLLSRIEEKFNSLIVPMIKNEESSTVIDLAISQLIILPLADEVAPADATLTPKQIRGMMFLLTGNCYLNWHIK
ncbi:ABC-three component system protein [Paraglaciecola sp. MB-3u-78]|jgi:hypothetical protein|uniref:ABC-three component system protein n=1 Tax=Paraglaciecola sp. MB-3u-78 TaxID=2058332 RepID=UPI000C33D769|nr:ABC-three component system protein [Paraglaciecola sp. MB-3u-78]PKG93314.1 hypothetical protein CXF95_27490 [Paraglaciecola sp. MB-3u-78]